MVLIPAPWTWSAPASRQCESPLPPLPLGWFTVTSREGANCQPALPLSLSILLGESLNQGSMTPQRKQACLCASPLSCGRPCRPAPPRTLYQLGLSRECRLEYDPTVGPVWLGVVRRWVMGHFQNGCSEGFPSHCRWVRETFCYVLNVTGSPCTENVCRTAITPVALLAGASFAVRSG